MLYILLYLEYGVTIFQREIEEFERSTGNSQPDFDMCDSDDPVEMFRSAVITLTTKGNVENYMKPIIAKLKNGNHDVAVINEMIDILFNHVSKSVLVRFINWKQIITKTNRG